MNKRLFKNHPFIITSIVLFLILFLNGCINDEIKDSDGDGISDQSEINGWQITIYNIDGTTSKTMVFSNKNKVDTDGDGLNDYEEMNKLSNTSNIDTDGDGIKDGDEESYRTSLIHFDSWIINIKGQETRVIANYSKHGNQAIQYDSDFDGLNDYEEYQKETDPLKKDTDSDGDNDYIDPEPLWNLQLQLDIKEFTLKKNMDSLGGADLYFEIKIGSKTLTTDIWKVSYNQENKINVKYSIDFPDRNAFDNNKLNIIISGFDEDKNSFFGAQPIEINDSDEDFSLEYDINNTNTTNYSLVGDEGELDFSIKIIRL